MTVTDGLLLRASLRYMHDHIKQQLSLLFLQPPHEERAGAGEEGVVACMWELLRDFVGLQRFKGVRMQGC